MSLSAGLRRLGARLVAQPAVRRPASRPGGALAPQWRLAAAQVPNSVRQSWVARPLASPRPPTVVGLPAAVPVLAAGVRPDAGRGGKGGAASRPLHHGPRPQASVAGAARTAVAVVAAVVLVGLLFLLGSIVIGLGLAAALLYATSRRVRGRAASSAASSAMRAGGRSTQQKTRSTPLQFSSASGDQPPPWLPAALLRLLAPMLRRAMDSAAETAVDVQVVRAEVEDLLSKSRAAADALGTGPQICGVRSIADRRVNHLRSLEVCRREICRARSGRRDHALSLQCVPCVCLDCCPARCR